MSNMPLSAQDRSTIHALMSRYAWCVDRSGLCHSCLAQASPIKNWC